MTDAGVALRTDFEVKRREMAFELLRRMVGLVQKQDTERAPAPLALHKGVYTDPERFERERELIFLGQPILAGLSGDIPKPGDFMVFDSLGPSILVMRGDDGKVRAFRNMCTHRGAKLIEAVEPYSARRRRIVCPFHAWCFDSKGALVAQPSKRSFDECAIGARDLLEVPCAEHLGLIFVRVGGGESIDAVAHLGQMEPVMAALEMHLAEPVKKGILTADANWKFALDTYSEGYHFSALHGSTIGITHFTDIGAIDRFDRHHRVVFPDKSMAELAGQPESAWPELDYSAVHYLFPNTIVFFGAVQPGKFFTQVFRLFPDGVGRMRCHYAVYAPFGVENEAHRVMCEMAYDATSTVVQTEDYRVASSGYANLLHAPDDFHIVLGSNENAVQLAQRHIADAIGLPLG